MKFEEGQIIIRPNIAIRYIKELDGTTMLTNLMPSDKWAHLKNNIHSTVAEEFYKMYTDIFT